MSETKELGRRRFLALAGAAGVVALPAAAQRMQVSAVESGAKADGKTLNTVALQKAIDAAHAAGGGVVMLTPGVYLTGGLVLKSNVTLHVAAGATLLGSRDTKDYAYQEGPPEEGDANGRHLLFARDAENVAIEGLGTIDGSGAAFWHKKGRPAPKPEDMWGDVIAWDYEPATSRRPSPMLEFAYCRNLRIEGVTLANAPGWTMRPVASESVFIRGVRVRNPIYAPNTDGMDITACRNVFVSDCDIATGDDAICIKSENPYGEMLPTKNITVTNCVLTTCCNGFKVGTATHGRVENIVFSNSVIYNDASSPLNERVIAGVALEMVDGGSMDGVSVSNIRMENTRTPIFIRMGERTVGKGSAVRNIKISGVVATGALQTSSITGVPGLVVENVTISDVTIQTVEEGKLAWTKRPIPEVRAAYPEARMMGRLPASGMYVRHARGIALRHVEFRSEGPDERPVVMCDDVQDVEIYGLKAQVPAAGEPVIRLRETQGAFVVGCRAPLGAGLLLEAGEGCSGVAMAGNELSGREAKAKAW